MNRIKFGKDIVLFGSIQCPACLAQIKLLNEYFKDKPFEIGYYDLQKKQPPNFLVDKSGSYSMPTWYFPDKNGYGKLIKGVVMPNKFTKYNSFGNVTPQINSLAKYGRNFPNNEGFQIKGSFQDLTKQKWGNILNSGTLGREFGPGNTSNIYSKNYFYAPRMAIPGGDLSTAIETNRQCNIINSNINPVTKAPGLFFDSKKYQDQVPQFGNRYLLMGPAFERNNQYLVKENTFKNLYAGGTQGPLNKPSKVQDKKSYIGQSPVYNPLKIKEGSILELGKNNKIKVH